MQANNSRVTVRLPEDLRKRVKEAARRTGRRESDLIREAVEKQFKEKPSESSYDRLKRAGLIGAAKGLPRDLSTNKKCFEGFGKSCENGCCWTQAR